VLLSSGAVNDSRDRVMMMMMMMIMMMNDDDNDDADSLSVR
jgi:hypothetical protein